MSITVRLFNSGERKVISTRDIVSVEGSAENRHRTISIGSFVEVRSESQTGDGATAGAVVIDCGKAAAASRKRQRDYISDHEEENMDSDETEKMESPGDSHPNPKRKRPHNYCTCRSEIEELKAEIQGIKSDIANIKQLPRSSISSDMDDLESLFSSLDGGCSPFTPLATGTTSHQNLMSPPPLPPTIRPRANSLPSTIPTVGPFSPDHFSYHTPQCTETFQTGDSSQSSRITHSQFAGLPHPSSLAPPTTQPSTSSLLQPATQPSTSSLLQPATQPSTSSLLQPATQPSTSSLLQPATQPSTSSPLQPATQPSTSLFQPVPQPVLQPSTSLFQPVTQPFQLSTQPSTSLFQITTQPSTGLFQLTPQPLIGQPTTQPLTSLTTSSPGPSQQLVPQQQPPSKKLTVPMPIPDYMPIKTAEEVFAKYDKFLTSDMIGRVAVKLARNTFFGEKVLQGSSIGGTEDTRPLDPNKMREMRAVIRKKFPTVSPTEFELLWGKCVDSISRLCTYCRKSK